MKKSLLLTLGLLMSLIGFAQNFTVTADTLEGYYEMNDYPADYNFIENVSSNDLQLSYTRLTNTITTAPNFWTAAMCTQDECMSNLPASGVLGTFASGENGFINVHLSFNENYGTGLVSYRIYETLNPTNADTITFVYHLVDLVAVNDLGEEISVKNFPNPTQDFLNISGLDNVSNYSVNIFNIKGQRVYDSGGNNSVNSIDVAAYDEGTYILTINKDAKVIYSSKFQKI